MPQFEVTYSVVENIKEGKFGYSGPSHYTITVTAPHQNAAEQMVKNMNGGANHCLVRSCRIINF